MDSLAQYGSSDDSGSDTRSGESQGALMAAPPAPSDLDSDDGSDASIRPTQVDSFLQDRYLVHVFISVSDPMVASFVSSRLAQARGELVGCPVKASFHALDDFHISLTRPTTVCAAQISELVRILARACCRRPGGFVELDADIVALPSQNGHRLYIAAPVSTSCAEKTVIPLIRCLDKAYSKLGLPSFFEEPRPHMSFAWTENLDVLPVLRSRSKRDTDARSRFNIPFRSVGCKIGSVLYTLGLRESADRGLSKEGFAEL